MSSGLDSITPTAPQQRSASPSNFVEHARFLSELALLCANEVHPDVERAAQIVAEALGNQHKVLACGNGGSAADAQHFVAELVGHYIVGRPPLAAISLTTDTSILTAIGNDYGYEEVFARQVEAVGRAGDVLILLTTSGRSRNVIRAAEVGLTRDLRLIALTGASAHKPIDQAEAWCRVPSSIIALIQEMHTVILHEICARAEVLLGFERVES